MSLGPKCWRKKECQSREAGCLTPSSSLISCGSLHWLTSSCPSCCSICSSLHPLFAAEPKSFSASLLLTHSHCPTWQAGRPTLLSFSSTAPLSVSFNPPHFATSPSLRWTPQLAPSLSALQPAASINVAPSLLHLSAWLKASFMGLFIYPPSHLWAKLLTSCRFHDHGRAGSLRQTALRL